MKLNPLQPNYLHKLSFPHRAQNQIKENKIELRHTALSKPNRLDQQSNTNSANTNIKNINFSAKFALENHLSTSNLHYTK
jgi:hypothetical protein